VKTRRQTDEEYARSLGFSRSTLQRLQYIRHVAEAPEGAVPDVARRTAQQALDEITAGHGRAVSLRDYYEIVRYAVTSTTVRQWQCAQCGTEMTDENYRPDARYCSPKCRQKAYRQRT
jgi:hypothetical protein